MEFEFRQSESPFVLYIAGYGRSGSTVLDLALSATCETAISIGEAVKLPSSFEKTRLGCSCGHSYRDCVVWKKCIPSCFLEQDRRVGKVAEKDSIMGSSSTFNEYRKFWLEVFNRRIQLSAERNDVDRPSRPWVIIDSSKTTINSYSRIKNLAKDCKFQVYVVDLRRNIAEIMRSRSKGRNASLAGMGHKLTAKEKIFGYIWWLIVPCHVWLARLGAKRWKASEKVIGWSSVDFSDLKMSPEQTALSVWNDFCRAAGIDLDVRQTEDGFTIPDHMIEGNRIAHGSDKVRIRK